MPEQPAHVVVTIGTTPHRTDARTTPEDDARSHTLVVDVPPSKGGSDQGPSPHDLLLTSLGSCIAITCNMYATRKQWPLEGIDVGVRHDLPAERGGKERLTVTLAFRGDLSPEQHERLTEIAHKCPVHKAITAGVEVQMTASMDT
ncbi:MAG: OsmC family protein [Planctomycetota bacterium]